MEKAEMLELVDEVVDAHNADKAFIITMMQQIQKRYRYLPKDALIHLAKRLDVSESKVYGVATFYENFSLNPKGENIIKICDNIQICDTCVSSVKKFTGRERSEVVGSDDL